jgi:hypothetical protein
VTAASQRFLLLGENPLRAVHMSLEALVHMIVPGGGYRSTYNSGSMPGDQASAKRLNKVYRFSLVLSNLVVGQLATGNEQGRRAVALP